MPAYICTTCGTQYEPAPQPPASCPICLDERQYVPPQGQSWTTLDAMRLRYQNAIHELEPGLISLLTFPHFAIGQRAMLLRTPNGNILWDCIAFIDRASVEMINAMGGVKAIAISHPHYYTTMTEWSAALGGVPVYLHEADRKWIMRSGPTVKLWKGESTDLLPGVSLICSGGHYPGATVLHWAGGSDGKGTLLSGDILQVVQDNKSVSFMWSYPNIIPLSAPRVESLVNSLKPYKFERIHGAFVERTIWSDGNGVLERSAERYLRLIRGDGTYELQ
jgi:hypothetical protein